MIINYIMEYDIFMLEIIKIQQRYIRFCLFWEFFWYDGIKKFF